MSNIILIGFMGSGKTTFGKWLAGSWNMGFCDTDELIEAKEDRTINDIFSKKGEEYFRDLETEMIKALIDERVDRVPQNMGLTESAVISVGGGLPVRPVNRELMHRLGICVYLRTSKEELVRRLQSDTTRPLLAGGRLEEKISSLMAARRDIYESVADLILDTDNMSFEAMADTVKRTLAQRKL